MVRLAVTLGLGLALVMAFCLDVASGMLGARRVGLREARGIWGGTQTLAAGPSNCTKASTCTGLTGCAAASCVICPPTPNFSYITGASKGATVNTPCPAGSTLGVCVSGPWWACFCSGPVTTGIPCGPFPLNTITGASG